VPGQAIPANSESGVQATHEQQHNFQPTAQPSTFNHQPLTFNAPETRINPRQGPAIISPIAVQPAQRAGSKKSAVGVIIVVMGIASRLVAFAGFLIYLKYFRRSVPNPPRAPRSPPPRPDAPVVGAPTPAPSVTASIGDGTGPAGTASSAEAAAHLAAGKEH